VAVTLLRDGGWPVAASAAAVPRREDVFFVRTRWMMRWKPALNAFAITFGDRFPAAETY
jgi:hypothetical protein